MITMASELTALDNVLLDTLRTSEDWQSRSDIADMIGRKTLTHYDIERLERMVDAGLIEKSTRTVGVVKKHYVYRLRGE